MNDLISRQAAIDAFWKLDAEIRPSAINAIIDTIRTLPSAETPKRTGKSAQNVLNDDLISRKAAIDAIDTLYFDTVDDHDRTKKRIKRLPTAQPEIIHCKDCKYHYPSFCKVWSKYGTIQTKASGFCFLAERKTE